MQISMANKTHSTKTSKAVQNIRQSTGPAGERHSLENICENSLSQRLLVALLVLFQLSDFIQVLEESCRWKQCLKRKQKKFF